MTAKEYLSQLMTMDNAINRKQQRLMTLRDVAMNTTPELQRRNSSAYKK